MQRPDPNGKDEAMNEDQKKVSQSGLPGRRTVLSAFDYDKDGINSA